MKTYLAIILIVITVCSSAFGYDLIIDFPGRYELDLKQSFGPHAQILINPEFRPEGQIWVNPDGRLYCEVMFYGQLGQYDQMTIYWQSYKPEGVCDLSWWTITGWHIDLRLKN